MSDIGAAEGGGIIPPPEAQRFDYRKSENGPTREDATSAFNFVWSRFDAAPLTNKWQIDSRDAMRGFLAPKKRGNIDYGARKFSHQKTSPSVFGVGATRQEYMPIDDMLDWINNEISHGKLSPEEYKAFLLQQ